MSSLLRLLLVTFPLSFLWGCNAGPEAEALSGDELNTMDQSLVTCSAQCGTRTTLTCTGNVCSAVDGPTGFVTCDGVTKACKQCEFEGVYYNDGQRVTSDVRCSAKLDGVCIGGPVEGKACVSTGNCYALCVNGTWQ
ncbi:hypothetical protein [Corallococcus aberystwythensis]|uniref:hypothetical protein n=1 Tax=Corallococcus aberystwythensis TaxID=2316722 RepID=UPI0011C36983|nr:hypothetical protein [Corallococcus aberystwythensis]